MSPEFLKKITMDAADSVNSDELVSLMPSLEQVYTKAYISAATKYGRRTEELEELNRECRRLVQAQRVTMHRQMQELASVEAHYASLGMGLYNSKLADITKSLEVANDLITEITMSGSNFDLTEKARIKYNAWSNQVDQNKKP